ncbi:hypothetical protein [Bdellovibrio sp. HCB274]
MKAANFFESIMSERNRAGQGVQRDLPDNDIPAEIRSLLQTTPASKK